MMPMRTGTMTNTIHAPIATELKDAWHVPVAGEDASQTRKIREGRIRRQHQQQSGRDLDEVMERTARANEQAGQLADDGLFFRRIRDNPELAGQEAHAQ